MLGRKRQHWDIPNDLNVFMNKNKKIIVINQYLVYLLLIMSKISLRRWRHQCNFRQPLNRNNWTKSINILKDVLNIAAIMC
jgi:hypothetical protein